MKATWSNAKMLQTWPSPNYFQHLSARTRSCPGGTVGRKVRHERYPWCLQQHLSVWSNQDSNTKTSELIRVVVTKNVGRCYSNETSIPFNSYIRHVWVCCRKSLPYVSWDVLTENILNHASALQWSMHLARGPSEQHVAHSGHLLPRWSKRWCAPCSNAVKESKSQTSRIYK